MDKLDKDLAARALHGILKDNALALNKFKDKQLSVQKHIIELIYTAQAKTIRNGIENKDTIMIPGIGTLKIKATRLKAIEYSKTLLKEYNVETISELDKEQRLEYEDKMSELMSKEILKRKKSRYETKDLDFGKG